MKKLITVSQCVLFTLIAILPLAMILSACFGYIFELKSYTVYAIVMAVISLFTLVISFFAKNPCESKLFGVITAVTAPLSLITVVLWVFRDPSVLASVFSALCAICCFVLAIKNGRPKALKIASTVLTGLLILPLCFLAFMALIFGNIGSNTVVYTTESPAGGYYAQVIDSNQGAMGGNTLVEVCENSEIDTFAFRIYKEPQRVYSGEWGEYHIENKLDVYWKNENCLVINDVEYVIE